jgi:hypothetical protein
MFGRLGKFPFVVVFLCAAAGVAAGDWRRIEDMHAYHYQHVAPLLTNGDVLITAGYGYSPPPFDEVFDADLERWFVGAKSPCSSGHGSTATVLKDGRVLVTCQIMAVGDDISAIVYDKTGKEWVPTPTMVLGNRIDHTATLLNDGRVLMAGGQDSPTGSRTAELFVPQTGTWFATDDMFVGRYGHTATLLQSGEVLVVGGTEISKLTETYDPTTGKWSPAWETAFLRDSCFEGRHTATLLRDGRVLVVGGCDERGEKVLTSEVFDPVTRTWSLSDAPLGGAAGHTTTLLPSGKIVLLGGGAGGWIYDPANGVVSSVEHAPGACLSWYAHTATLLHSGQILVAGGDLGPGRGCDPIGPDGDSQYTKESYLFDTGEPSWCKVCPGDGTCTTMIEGLSCDDGDTETTDDHCDGNGNCVAGPWDAGVDAGIDADGGVDAVFPEDGPDSALPDSAGSDGGGSADVRPDGAGASADAGPEVIIYAPGCGCAQVGM